jgi:2-haloacid dehalogenase
VPFDVVVTAERAGAYKPRPEPYHYALEELAVPPEAVLFVAGSPNDLIGAGAAGMPVWWHNRVHLDRALRRRRSLSMTRSGLSRLRCWPPA